jgi:hypothetical protein
VKTQHEDKAIRDPYLGRSELMADIRRFEDARRDWLSDAEKAGEPTVKERAQLDAALTGWQEAAAAASVATQAAAEAQVAVSAASRTKLVRGRGGLDEVPAASLAELSTLEATARQAAHEAAIAGNRAHEAQRTFNATARAVSAAGAARRSRAEATENHLAFLAAKRARGGKVDEAEVRAAYGLGPSRFERIRLIFSPSGVRARTLRGSDR